MDSCSAASAVNFLLLEAERLDNGKTCGNCGVVESREDVRRTPRKRKNPWNSDSLSEEWTTSGGEKTVGEWEKGGRGGVDRVGEECNRMES